MAVELTRIRFSVTDFHRMVEAGIREVWLVDLDNQRLERHSDPQLGSYRDVIVIGRGQMLASTVVPALVLATDQILRAG